MAFQSGVLPDDVIRDAESEAALILLHLDPGLGADQAKEFLARLSGAVDRFETKDGGHQVGSAVVAFGPAFFAVGGAPRFNAPGGIPDGMQHQPSLDVPDRLPEAEIMIYAMTPEEARLAALLQEISRLRPLGLAGAQVERGFQRRDGREMFGNRDGLRNVPWHDRYQVIFINRDEQSEEPQWTEDGSYLAYLKIRQNFEAWDGLSEDDKHRTIGRRLSDGSRLDLPEGTDPHDEPDFQGVPPDTSSHVHKVGPRSGHDDAAVFRRGVPYFGLDPDGTAHGGLQFVSFQATLRAFDVIFNEWMGNADFPQRGAGVDQLFQRGLVTVERGGFFFAPPADSRFLGGGFFDQPRPEPRPRNVGRLLIRKKAIDANNNPVRADLDGVVFQVLKAADRSAVGEQFPTNPAGHASSGDLPVRTDLILQEVSAPPHLEPSGEIPFRLEQRRQLQEVINRLRPESPYGA